MFKKDNKGFTIIEVLIVLAIAGLILLIVFLAVPALQRNSRNQSIKSEAASGLSALVDFSSANNGRSPTALACTDGECVVSGATGTNDVSFNANANTVFESDFTGVVTWNSKADAGKINLLTGYACDNNTPVAIPRGTAAQFLIETGTGSDDVALQCVES